MNKALSILGLILIGLVIGGFIAYAITTYLQLSSTGNLQLPATLSASPSNIDWGKLYQGGIMTSNKTVRLTNIGDLDTKPLTYSETWTNPITPLGTIATNITNAVIPAHSYRFYWFNLTITDTIYVGDFTFSIIIQG